MDKTEIAFIILERKLFFYTIMTLHYFINQKYIT